MKNNVICVNNLSIFSPLSWLKRGAADLLSCLSLSVFYGLTFTLFIYLGWNWLSSISFLHDMALPILAIVILVLGPISALSLYAAAKTLETHNKPSLIASLATGFRKKTSQSSIFLSMLLVLLVVAYMMFSPIFYAIFNSGNLAFIENDNASLLTAIWQHSPITFKVFYIVYTLGFAWLAFMISWFSFPMIFDKDVEPYLAVRLSLRASLHNKIMMIIWIGLVLVIIVVSLTLPYFIGLVVAIPLLAYSTWHAYRDMFSDKDN